MDNLKQKTVKAFSFDLINRFSKQGASFVISIFLARLLSPGDFGLIAMINVIISLATVISDMGLGSALIQRKNVTDEHYGSVFYFNMSIGIFFTITLFLSAGSIAHFYEQPDLKPLIRVLSLTFLFNSFCTVRLTWLRKHLQYSVITSGSVLSLISGGITGVIMAFSGYGVWSLVGQSMIGIIVNNMYIYFRTKWKPKLILNFNALKDLWGYGIYIFLSSLLDMFFNQLDNLIIGKLFNPISLGLYNRAKSLNGFVNDYSSASLMAVLFPVLSSVNTDYDRYIKIIYRSFHLINFVTFLITGMFYLCAKDFILLLFGMKWLPSADFYSIMVLGGCVYPLSALLINILSSRGKAKSYFRLTWIKKSILAVNFLIGFYFGIKGFLYGLLIVNFIALGINIAFAAKEINLPQKWFYSIMWKYIVLVLIIASGLGLISHYMDIKNYVVHMLIFASAFLILYLASAKFADLEGLTILKDEISKLNISSRIKKNKERK